MSVEALCMCDVCCGMSSNESNSWGCLFVVVECGDSNWSPDRDCDGKTVGG